MDDPSLRDITTPGDIVVGKDLGAIDIPITDVIADRYRTALGSEPVAPSDRATPGMTSIPVAAFAMQPFRFNGYRLGWAKPMNTRIEWEFHRPPALGETLRFSA